MDPQTERAAARVGTLLKGKWRLDELVGVGGMAAVYAATHRNGKRVAVKMLHADVSIDKDIHKRFVREGYVANSVGHPGAVTVDDDDVADDGSAFLVMELLQGETLDARMRRKGPLPADEVLSLMDQVLSTLAAAHTNGIIHRDLKPENIFLTRDGATKVLDFGIARVRQLSGNSSSTQTGAVMGTPAFMPPEQARSRWDEVDTRTDLWAIGATMFTLLTGRYVHEAETVTEALALAVLKPAPSLASVDESLPEGVIQLVDRALAQDKADRWQDAVSMQQAVREAFHTLGSPEPPAGYRASIADESGVGFAAHAAQPSVTASTGPGLSSTLGRGEVRLPGVAAAMTARSRKIILAAIAGVTFVGTVALLRGGSGTGTVVTGAASSVATHEETPPIAPNPLAARAAPAAPSAEPYVQPALQPELEPAPPKAEKRPTTATGRVPDVVPTAQVASPTTPPKPAPVVLDKATATKPAPSAATKPKPKPVADPFTGRF